MRLVVATRNSKKVREIGRMFEGTGMELIGLDAYPGCPEAVEDRDTFEGNAIKKAETVAGHTGCAALADDSGLVVDALGGAPGVYSARYAGEGATDDGNVRKLLDELGSMPDADRTARFVCVMALVMPGEGVRVFEGRVEGTIGRVPAGNNGFGYDPVFYPEGRPMTFAEMAAHEKDSMSHRGRALARLKEYLSVGGDAPLR